MKFSLSWLKDHLETHATAVEIAEKLTMIGLEVEAVIDRGVCLRDFVVAEVIEARPHPNADKLQVCVVETGSGRLQVVCGAPNARAGLKSVFAPVGSFIPGAGIRLKAAAIRGVESAGMLLSEREMQLSDDYAGIVELPSDSPVGAPAAEVMGLADPIIDVAVTPNRGDCLGVRGIARDLAAAGLGTLRPLDTTPVAGRFASPIGIRLEFAHGVSSACPYFAGRLIRGVRNGESPRWLRERLLTAGLRSISALVDITNYLTLHLCRPLHAFDADRLAGDIHVRLARDGERLLALNGREYELKPEMTVVADGAGALSLGGVIGGEPTACTEATANVFVESALFDPVRTAITGRMLNVQSDARYRFERGIDPTSVSWGLEVATRLILDICGGEPSTVVVAGNPPPARSPIAFRPDRVRTLAGVVATVEECARTLTALGFIGEFMGETWRVKPPPWRNDIANEVCLVEEVIRLLGYDRIPAAPLPRQPSLPKPALSPLQRRRVNVRRALASHGLVEAVTYSFISARAAEPFGGAPERLRLVNPISTDLDVMRPSLLPNLILAAQRNADRGLRDAALYEIGPQYVGDRPEEQAIVVAAVRAGRTGHRHWAEAARPVDAFDSKADALAALETAGAPIDKLTVATEAPGWYHPGRSGVLKLGPKRVLARFGEIHPRVLTHLGASRPVVGCEVFIDAVPLKSQAGADRPPLKLSPLQPIERDFAFVVDAEMPAETLVQAARAADRTLINDVRVFDVFEGGGRIGKKSIAITVVLQPSERTLTDAEIEELARRVIERIENATGGALRS